MRVFVIILIIFVASLIIGFLTCTSEHTISDFYHDRDSLAFRENVASNHFQVRKEILAGLSRFLRLTADDSLDTADSLYQQLEWLIGLYNDETGIRDLSNQLIQYTKWDGEQAHRVLALRKAQAKLMRERHSLPLITIRQQLEELHTGYVTLNDSIQMAVIAKDVAQLFETHNDIDSALYYYRDCLHQCRKLDYFALMGNCRMLMARIHNYRKGDYFRSEVSYADAIRNFRMIGDKNSIQLIQMGRIYDFLQLYQTEKAIDLCNAVLSDLDDDPDKKAYCKYFLGVAYCNLGMMDSALCYAEASSDIRRTLAAEDDRYQSDLGYSLNYLGLIYHRMGVDNRALSYFRVADSVLESAGDKEGMAVNLIGWGNLHIEKGEYDSARVILERISGKCSSYENIIFYRYGLALCDYYTGNTEQVISELKNFIAIVEQSNRKLPMPALKTGLLSDKIGFYNLLVTIYIKRFMGSGDHNFIDSAFHYLERSKSRALIDNLSQTSERESDSVADRYRQRITDIHKSGLAGGDIKTAMRMIHDLEDSLMLQFVEHVKETSADTDIKEIAGRYVDITTLQETLLNNGAVLLEYLLSYFGNYVFIISDDQYTIAPIDIEFDSVRTLISQYLDQIESLPDRGNPSDQYIEAGKRLYSLIIPETILESIGAKELLIVASGPLHYLPLESLVDENGGFLVEKYDISYVPSALALNLISERGGKPSKIPSAVAFANSPSSSHVTSDPLAARESSVETRPYWITDDLAPLPSCDKEIQTIRNCFGSKNAKIFMGDDATETNFKNTDFINADYVHIAAHGLTDDRNPDRSAIILATGEDDANDGLLRPQEILELDVPARLVFLSSCRSGRGKMFPGEGVLNLARPFIIAGCGSAIVTYWNINDISSAEFVRYFYSFVKDGNTHSQALSRAKWEFINSGRTQLRHPYYWAPFVLIGR